MKVRYYLFSLLFMASSVFAEGFYAELAVGEAEQKTTIRGLTNYSAKDMSLGLQVGYQFLPYMAVELGYTDYGQASKSKSGIKGSMETTAINTGVKFIMPIGKVASVYVKTGIAWWDYQFKALGIRTSEKDKDFYYGAGAKFNLNEVFALGVEYQAFSMDIDKNGFDAKHKIDNMALTFSVLF